MKSITFFDLEIDANSHGIADIGGIKSNGETFHSTSMERDMYVGIIYSSMI